MLAVTSQPYFFNLNSQKPCINAFVCCQIPKGKWFFLNMGSQRVHRRTIVKQPSAIQAVSAGLEDTQISSSQFREFSVTTCSTDKYNELKISIDVSGAKTQAVFDDVFSKMVADAQPIPGFEESKGTPNIPKDILLEILGLEKVYKQVIKKVINSTISEYVQKEGLKVGKDLQVQQSFEDLEAVFEPGEQFSFEAILQCEDSN